MRKVIAKLRKPSAGATIKHAPSPGFSSGMLS
jgi:hypothetical protein